MPDLEQHPYHMWVNSFARFETPDLEQHRWYGTVYGSIRSEQEANIAATGLCTGHFVRKIAELKQHCNRRTVYGSIRSEIPGILRNDRFENLEEF